jgi:hypothetical protein
MSLDPELKAITDGINGFATWGHAQRIRFFAWFLLAVKNKPSFATADITTCYDGFHYDRPNISQMLKDMAERKPPVLLKRGSGYVLEGRIRAEHDEKYGTHGITLNIRQQVKDLINSVPNIAEKEFMKEAEICLRNGAARGTIIMVWSIAFYHLCQWVLTHHLATFDARIPVYSKRWKVTDLPIIQKYDDFGDKMSEREVIEVCNSASIITGDLHKILVKNLGTRNSAAHPSSVLIGQLQAEALIDDLTKNVILALPI